MIRQLHNDPTLAERMVFIDHGNKIRWEVYSPEFDAKVLGSVRDHLEKEGVLKAVIHVGAGGIDQLGTSRTYVEYLPDEHLYTLQVSPLKLSWVETNAEEEDDPGSLLENGGKEDK